jgi:hypothetical protein
MSQYYKPEFFFGVQVSGTSPSPLGGLWYDPDVNHAAFQLRTIYENRMTAFEKATLASEYIKSNFSLQVFAGRLESLLSHF